MKARSFPFALLPALALIALLPACVGANVSSSPRPEARPEAQPEAQPESRPEARPNTAATTPATQSTFTDWLTALEPRTRAAGITPATWARALPHLRYLPDTVALDRRQSEFGARVWDYLDSAVTPARIAQGQTALRQHASLLARVAARYGVPPEIVVAIWGIETSFGANRGRTPTLATLATLAKDGRRGAFFEGQLIDALRIVQAGDKDPGQMIGSWAGAFGHVQFMPSSYLSYAVDFTGDGRRDLWSDNPGDALASAANYLAQRGWTQGQHWAIEVTRAASFDLSLTGQRQGGAAWATAGLRAANGDTLPASFARLILPGGASGPAFLTYGNYDVLKEYNISDAYVLALGHLSDRLAGGAPLRAPWPRQDRALTLAERIDLQRRLTALGHDTAGVDGRLGPATVAAVQEWQRARGMAPDGYVNATLLTRLRRD